MKFYQKTWFIVLSLFLFAPLGLFLMWCYKPTWSKVLKGALTGFFCIWFICFLAGSFSDTPSEAANGTSRPNSEVQDTLVGVQSVLTTEPTTEQTTEPTTEAPSTTLASATESKASSGSQVQSGSNTGTSGNKSTQSAGQSSNKQGTGQSSGKQSGAKATTTQNRNKGTTTQDPNAQVTVYITKSGKRYHNENPCGNGTYYPVSLAEAKSRGYTPCEKCVLH